MLKILRSGKQISGFFMRQPHEPPHAHVVVRPSYCPDLCSIQTNNFFQAQSNTMLNNLFFTALLSVASVAAVSAQASAQIATTRIEHSELTATVDNLEQIALFTLAGVIVLAGMFFIFYVVKSCSGLNRTKHKTRHNFIHLMFLAVGLCSVGSSCTSLQQALATETYIIEKAETRSCPLGQHDDYWAKEMQSNRYTNYFSNQRNVPVFCRYCGQRISKIHR